MSIPGANLLGMASRLIQFQAIDWCKNLSTAQDAAGIDVSTFAPAVPIRASVQAVPRAVMVRDGLDLNSSYLMVYTKSTLQDLKRDKTPDKLIFGGRVYSVDENTNWKIQDGWLGSRVVDTGPA